MIPDIYLIIWLSNLSILRVNDEVYSRNAASGPNFDIYALELMKVNPETRSTP